MMKNTGLLAGLVTIAIIVGAFWLQLTVANGAWMLFRSNSAGWLLIVAAVIAGFVAFLVLDDGHGDAAIPVLATIVFTLGAVGVFVAGGYAKDSAINDSTTVVQPEGNSAAIPTYKTRAPFVIAEQQTQDNTTINGSPGETTYVPELDRFGALVVKRGLLQGYGQIVWQKIDESGQATVKACSFNDLAGKRLGGKFTHNLERAIMRKDFGIKIDSADTYGYCNEDGEPLVVVPLKKYKGFLFPIEVPAGVGVYNGATGSLEVKAEVKNGDIPGPVYPISLAEKAREATTASDGFWSWIQNRVGFKEYGGENSGDYTLRRNDDKGDAFVTPLTMIGRGKAITAVGMLSANEVTTGKLNEQKIAILPMARQGDSAVEDRLKSDYRTLEWATGMGVFEIVPTGPNKWAATLGLRKSITYRLEIEANGNSCLFTVKGEKLRCTTDSPAENSDKPAEDDPSVTVELPALTDQELLKLQQEIQDEVAERFIESSE